MVPESGILSTSIRNSLRAERERRRRDRMIRLRGTRRRDRVETSFCYTASGELVKVNASHRWFLLEPFWGDEPNVGPFHWPVTDDEITVSSTAGPDLRLKWVSKDEDFGRHKAPKPRRRRRRQRRKGSGDLDPMTSEAIKRIMTERRAVPVS